MKPEQINVAIAEFCGWSDIYIGGMTSGINYYVDRNAIHDAVLRLSENQKCQYIVWLNAINRDESYDFNLAFSTSKQQCEALLRTIGKWEESK